MVRKRETYRTHFKCYVARQNDDGTFDQIERPTCGTGRDAVNILTSDRAKVTCGRCLQRMEMQARGIRARSEDA